jgi:hypothetical protein
MYVCICGLSSSVGIATELGAVRSGDLIPIGTIFSARPDRPWGSPTLLYNGYLIFPGGKVRPGRDADYSPLLAPRSWMSRAIPQLPSGPQPGYFTFTLYICVCSFIYIYIYIYIYTEILQNGRVILKKYLQITRNK